MRRRGLVIIHRSPTITIFLRANVSVTASTIVVNAAGSARAGYVLTLPYAGRCSSAHACEGGSTGRGDWAPPGWARDDVTM
jgi:hypothetical protein